MINNYDVIYHQNMTKVKTVNNDHESSFCMIDQLPIYLKTVKW